MPMPRVVTVIAVAATLAAAPLAAAQVTVSDAWIRAVVPGQMATGAFMRVTAATDATLVAVASPAAGIVEIHHMKMEAGVMKMSAIAKLPLPAGQHVDLTPGGYHVMLTDLTRPLNEGDMVPITLTVVDKSGKTQTIKVSASVRAITATPPRTPAR